MNIPNEFSFRVGTEYSASPRATLVADLIGRTLISAGRLQLEETIWNYTDSTGVRRSTTLEEYVSQDASLNLTSLALGGKFNVTGNLLVNANVLLALTSTGVTARVTPVFGFDYSF